MLLCAFLSGCVLPPSDHAPRAKKRPAPATGKFWWGTAVSSYQNEDRGALPGQPGYFETDWDEFAREGRCPPRGEYGTFSWTNFAKDIRAMKKIGVNHFRFGVEWARVEPAPGVINHAALEHYVGMVRRLRAAGIEPVVTLWHFTFPAWAYDPKHRGRSNFLYPGIEEAWRKHVALVVGALKNDVKVWVPQNEPNGLLPLGYLGGHWPPGLSFRPNLYNRAMDVSVRMFRDAANIIHSMQPSALVMGTYSMPVWRKRWTQDPTYAVYNTMRHTNYDHLDRVYDVCDLIGVNYYYSQDASLIRFVKRGQGEVGSNYTQLGWEINPEGVHQMLMEVWQRYRMPLVVTENGLGTLSEQKKIRYFRQHLSQMRRAMADGADIRGYFAWTLVDNYEWKEGWNTNFGLTFLDERTGRLEIEPSGEWYARFIAAHPEP